MTLKPGETSDVVTLKVPLAAAIRGIILDEDGKQIGLRIALDYGPRENFPGEELLHYVGTNNGQWGPNDGRFGFYGLDSRPFRIRVGGWEVEPSEPIQLEAGEMRFIRVTLKKKLRLMR
jgi:hypothetical protein